MNQKDRDRLARLYTCMARLPMLSLTSTLSAGEYGNFYRNMERLQPRFMYTIMAISRCDALDPDEELLDLEETLIEMWPEAWHDR